MTDPKTVEGGFFIAFEGGEHSGKTTQAAETVRWLKDEGWLVAATREPGGTGTGRDIRAILLNPMSRVSDRAEALLFAADRAQHADVVIKPAMADGAVVVTDRYMDSSIAYQGVGRGLGVKRVRELSTWATYMLVPHLTVLLDIRPETAAERQRPGLRPDRIEAEDDGFHALVRGAFLELARQDEGRYLTIDAGLPAHEIQQLIRKRVLADLDAYGSDVWQR